MTHRRVIPLTSAVTWSFSARGRVDFCSENALVIISTGVRAVGVDCAYLRDAEFTVDAANDSFCEFVNFCFGVGSIR